MSLVIKGVLKAPTDPTNFSTDSWINFRYADRLTVSGGGTLDAQGQLAWRFNDCNKDSHCPALPTVRNLFLLFFL
jgi:galacturan 1,4-alpha-galacturonidase